MLMVLSKRDLLSFPYCSSNRSRTLINLRSIVIKDKSGHAIDYMQHNTYLIRTK